MRKITHIQRIVEPGPREAIAELGGPGQVAQPTEHNGRAGWPKLPQSLERFLRRQIDSYNKIWFPLLMHQHSEERLISREYIRQVTFADAPTLDKLIGEIRQAGRLTAAREQLRLDDAPELRRALDAMALAFEDPTGRQEPLRLLHRTPAAQL